LPYFLHYDEAETWVIASPHIVIDYHQLAGNIEKNVKKFLNPTESLAFYLRIYSPLFSNRRSSSSTIFEMFENWLVLVGKMWRDYSESFRAAGVISEKYSELYSGSKAVLFAL